MVGLALIALLSAGSGIATAAPGPAKVEVRNELGGVVGAVIAGGDGIELAMARIRTGRADDAKPWSMVVGAGTYGDALVDEPNLAISAEPGAKVTISGIGAADNTGKGCLDIRRGAVSVDSIGCRGQALNGIQVVLPASEGGVALRNIVVEQVGANGIEVSGGQGILIQNPTITAAGNTGITFIRTNGPGPYRIEGGTVRQSKQIGIDLHDDARNTQIAGVTVEANVKYGILSNDAGSSDLLIDGSRIVRNGTGVSFGAGSLRQAITNSEVTANSGSGILLGAGTGFVVRGIRFDGSNGGGDMRFSADNRAGGAYDGLTFLDTVMAFPGEPRGVILSASTAASRAGLVPIPPGFVNLGRFIRVRDIGSPNTSTVTLRFAFAPGDLAPTRTGSVQVYEEDRPGNGAIWQVVPGTAADPAGPIQITLSDSQIASGSDARYATYAPIGTSNAPPALRLIEPRAGGITFGRDVDVTAAVADDEALPAGQPVLIVDGKPMPGLRLAGGIARWTTFPIPVGPHAATITVTDSRGLQARADWQFTVRNGRPGIALTRANPGPGEVVRNRQVILLRVPLRDDLAPRRLRVRLRVDGERTTVKNRRGYAVARLRDLGPGVHRVVLTVRDAQGSARQRVWRFRVRGG